MRLFLIREKSGISATAEYDLATKRTVILKGARVSSGIAYSDRFRGAKTIENSRKGVVIDGVVGSDVAFKSASTAANFVTGSSTNGLTVWKDENGRKLKDIIADASENGGV